VRAAHAAKATQLKTIAGFVKSTPAEVQRSFKEDEERKARMQAIINRRYIQNCEKMRRRNSEEYPIHRDRWRRVSRSVLAQNQLRAIGWNIEISKPSLIPMNSSHAASPIFSAKLWL
jgi:hypothetical protein